MATTFKFVNVKRYKRGATWADGSTRLCTRCGTERRRRIQATTVANLTRTGSRFKVPVAYCDKHLPQELIIEEWA